MPFSDQINNYAFGATGTLTANGETVTYEVTNGAPTINVPNHGNSSAQIFAEGNDPVIVTFGQFVVGASVTFQGSDSNEFYEVLVDGVTVNLFDLEATGDVTFVNAGTVPTHTLNTDGTISGGANADGSIGQVIFNFPITSLGAIGSSGANSGNYDGVEIGIETATFDVVCFTSGTAILTSDGPRPVETLRVGDLVRTKDNGDKPIRWIGSRSFENLSHGGRANLRPVVITAGALGNGLPEKDLSVSRQHRILVSSKVVNRMFGVNDVLIPAAKLTAIPGIYVDESITNVHFFHILFDAHEVIFANGTPAESLHTGPEALNTIPVESLKEILAIFPELAQPDHVRDFVRRVPSGKMQKKLVERHVKNQKPLLELHETQTVSCP